MTDNLPPDNKPIVSDQAKPTDQPMSTPPSPEKKAILETPPQGTPIPPIATPPAAAIPPTTPVPDKKAIPETPPQGIPILQIPTPPAAETIPNKNSVDAITETPAPAPVTPPPVETPAFVIPETAAALPDIENPYILSGDVDRARLVAQTRLFKGYVEKNAQQFVGENVKSILDMGCGEGQLTQVLARLYPDAQIIGIDKDANAIEAARRAAKGLANVKFEVRDILQGLPSGPFDLVYASTVLIHLPSTPIVLKAIFDVLKPGGHLWTRDLHPDVDTAVDHPAYRRLTTWAGAAMAKIGASWKVGAELPSLLPAAGFTMLRVDKEAYTMGNETAEERIALSIDLGAFYNARKLITKMIQVPESDIEQTYREIVGAMLAPGGPRGVYPLINTVSQRPVVPIAVTPPPVETPVMAIPESATSLPELENPYLLSSEVDRARLVAQSRFFRSYIEKHAKEFLGENIKTILDIGCAEGQLTQVFARLYPDAQVLGVDKDPKAVETAKLAAKGIPNIRFEVCDLLQSLPPGPFDLVYESIVLQHIPGTAKIIKSIYEVLKPGGRLWMKDGHHSFVTAIDHPAFARMMNWLVTTMEKLGTPYKLLDELPTILATTGFTNVRTETEIAPAGNMSPQSRIVFSINVGALYNMRKPISNLAQVAEAEIEKAYRELVEAMLAGGAQGEYRYVNTIAQRPTTADKGNMPVITEATAIPASGGTALPETKTSS